MVLTATAVSMMRGENRCRCRAVPDDSHQIAQRQETHGECAYADGCDSADRPAVNPAGRSRTDGQGDAVHGGKEGDGRHSGGTDLDDDAWDVRQDRVHDVADETDHGGPDQEAPEEPDSTGMVPRRDFSWGRGRRPATGRMTVTVLQCA